MRMYQKIKVFTTSKNVPAYPVASFTNLANCPNLPAAKFFF